MHPRTPWRLGGAVLLASLGVNLATGNGLWTAYTLVGCLVFAAFWWLETRGHWDIPPRTMLALAVLGALHFLGGSLAGVHRAFGINGAYYVLPWWDNLAHFLGGAVAWLLFDTGLRQWLGVPQRRWATSLAAVAMAVSAGVLVELYEFSGFLFFGTVDQGFYVNTMLDLYYDLLGAGGAAVTVHLWARWEAVLEAANETAGAS